MIRCPNCGQKVNADSCPFCRYPILEGWEARHREAAKKARIEAERAAKEKAGKEAEEARLAKEAEQKARIKAELAAKEKARKEAEEARVAREAEQKAKREAEEQAKKARLEAELAAKEKAGKEAEEARVARETEQKARREAEEQAKKARIEAELAAREKARKEAEEARVAREAEQKARIEAERAGLARAAGQEAKREIYQGTFQLVLTTPVSSEQSRQFMEWLKQIQNLKIVWTGGSEEGILIGVSALKPIELNRTLQEMPMIDSFHRRGTDIVVVLKPPV